jgi:hypothetical protein
VARTSVGLSVDAVEGDSIDAVVGDSVDEEVGPSVDAVLGFGVGDGAGDEQPASSMAETSMRPSFFMCATMPNQGLAGHP